MILEETPLIVRISGICGQSWPKSRTNRFCISLVAALVTFFMAKRGYRAVGMCSVAAYYSTFSCSNTGVYEDFYIEPAFRGKGIARMLARAAQNWCRENGITSLTVCCAPCDKAMYQALGFYTSLGATFAHTE